MKYTAILLNARPVHGQSYRCNQPLPEVEEDLSRIPRAAEFYFADGGQSAAFRVTSERAPPICNHCGSLGHKEHACPVKEGLMENNFCEEAMDEDNENFAKMTDGHHPFHWVKMDYTPSWTQLQVNSLKHYKKPARE